MSSTRPRVACAGEHVVVALAGDVDLSVKADVLDAYDAALALAEVPHLLVDLGAVNFMDSTGLNTLAVAHNKVTARGGSVSIMGANERILDLLRLTQLDHVVTVLPAAECLGSIEPHEDAPPTV